MPNLDDTIESLREALKVSPDNLPLRMLLGENLLSSGRFDEAESEFTTALAKNPDNAKLAVSLAQACFSNGKYSQAQVILEDCLSKSEVPARAHLLYSRVMLNEGKLNDARTHYQSAIEREPGLKDQSLEDRLGLKEGTSKKAGSVMVQSVARLPLPVVKSMTTT
jgi:transitional endoplasmic reticulum ATPase